MTPALRRMLWPSSVAVIGAAPGMKWVRRIVSSLRTLGYKGDLFGVSADHDSVEGLVCYPAVGRLPRPVDAAVVVASSVDAVRAVRDCVEAGAGGVVVLAEGFAEAGPEGRALQERLCEPARRAGVPLIGPNCQGFINCLQPSALWTGDITEPPARGRVAVLSPSGAVATGLVNSFHVRGVGVTYAVSTGNEALVTTADLVDALAADEETRVIAAHLEAVRDPARFFAACDRAAAAGKPVVLVKAGRSQAARNAIQAHTGVLAGSDRMLDAHFRRHRVIRVRTLDELVETASACCGRRIEGSELTAFASSGAHIGLLADAAAATRFTFPAFAPGTAATLGDVVPNYRSGRAPNPLDIGFALREVLDTVAADPAIGTVLFVAQTRRRPTGVMDILTGYVEMAEQLHDRSSKPVVFLSANNDVEPALCARLAARGIPVLAGLEAGLRALELAHLHAEALPGIPRRCAVDPHTIHDLLRGLESPVVGGRALALLAALGVPVVDFVEVQDADGAVAAAGRFGYPVVLKTGAAGIVHKSETGQVAIDLMSAPDVRAAAARIAPPFVVQPQVARGIELIVGLQRDSDLGTCVAVGAGGVLAELLDKVALRPVPLRTGEAETMLEELPVWTLLNGYRGASPADVAAVVALIECVADVGEAAGSAIGALDLNPVIASPDGACVVDARVVLGDAGGERRERG
jgi:acetate---CoA ligase (ADP-forming)